MQIKEIYQRLQDGEVCTLTSLTRSQLVDMGYHFEDDQDHQGFYLTWDHNGVSLNATSKSNDPYLLFRGTESLGEDKGVEELISVGGPSFEKQWRGVNGFVELV